MQTARFRILERILLLQVQLSRGQLLINCWCEMEEENGPLVQFLRDRGISNNILEQLKKDKIDGETVKLMQDKDLALYLPARGDRLALFDFCKNRESTTEKNKLSLFRKLRNKMKLRHPRENDSDSDDSEEHAKSTAGKRLKGNKNAAKKTRRLELGWIHEGRQVRKKNGGGTRTIDVLKTATKKDLIKNCKEMFFPGGQSKYYSIEEVDCKILDFKEMSFPDNVTVGDLYEEVKMGIVRFYLSTTFKVPREEMGPKDVQSDNVPVVCHSFSSPADETRASTSRQPLQSTTSCHDALASTCTSTRSTQPSTIDHNLSFASSNIIQFGPTCCGNEHDLSDTLPLVDDIVEVETSELTDQWPDTLFAVNDDLTSSPRSPTPPPDVVSLTVHRVNILEEMVNHFKNEHILHEQINFTFVGEAGSDFTGVSREAYTAFWSEFFIGEAEGEESRVPAINTKWQEEEWRAVGRILLKGFSDHGVFPLQLSFVFATALIHREEDVKPEMLLEDFVSHLCPTERDLVQHALEGCIDDDEQEDLIDFFDRYGCRKVPMQDEMRSQVIQITHKQLIQRPKYALDKMKEVAQTGLSMYFPSCVEIKAMYKSKKPTVKKVLNLLDACPTTQDENQAVKYLQQFIRAQGEVSLKKLLRFLTSADIMCVDKIKVTFSKLEGLARRPIAHTCGPVLELPSTYQSYPEFRREMESLLSKEECFVMDIA